MANQIVYVSGEGEQTFWKMVNALILYFEDEALAITAMTNNDLINEKNNLMKQILLGNSHDNVTPMRRYKIVTA